MHLQFPTDGIYHCAVSISTPVFDETEHYTFTVQYAIEASMSLILADKNNAPITETSLVKPTYSEMLKFLLRRPLGSPLPTNCSWEIDYDNGLTDTSTDFINSDDEAAVSLNSLQHTLKLEGNYSVGGDFVVKFRIYNLISNASLTYEHRVTEEVSELNIDSIMHIVSMPYIVKGVCLHYNIFMINDNSKSMHKSLVFISGRS